MQQARVVWRVPFTHAMSEKSDVFGKTICGIVVPNDWDDGGPIDADEPAVSCERCQAGLDAIVKAEGGP